LFVRKFGLEWLWRIKEEPYLWSRYLADGGVLLSLMLTSVFPLVLGAAWRRVRGTTSDLGISANNHDNSCRITLSGMAIGNNVTSAVPIFREALAKSSELTIDVSTLRVIDARFFGLLLMIRKQLIERGGHLKFAGVSRRMERAFHMNRFSFLLPSRGASREVTDANWELGEATTRLRS
jgi:N-acetylglucosaminyldiphosphoundecaprenol N-acetyl-beta-D-mannosaminyltransferase